MLDSVPNGNFALFDAQFEIDRFFDNASLSAGKSPQFILIVGGVASGKTTLRKQKFATGFVVVDAAEIFLHLSRGKFYDFPTRFEELMCAIGTSVARRAIAERRHIVTELVGDDPEPVNALLKAMSTAGYDAQLCAVTCDVDVALARNEARNDDDISAHFAEPYQRSWLLSAAVSWLHKGHYPGSAN